MGTHHGGRVCHLYWTGGRQQQPMNCTNLSVPVLPGNICAAITFTAEPTKPFAGSNIRRPGRDRDRRETRPLGVEFSRAIQACPRAVSKSHGARNSFRPRCFLHPRHRGFVERQNYPQSISARRWRTDPASTVGTSFLPTAKARIASGSRSLHRSNRSPLLFRWTTTSRCVWRAPSASDDGLSIVLPGRRPVRFSSPSAIATVW